MKHYLSHKYDTLSSNEQQHLDKMIDEYTKKYLDSLYKKKENRR